MISVIVASYRYIPEPSWLLNVCLGLQMGGAVGNLIDRIQVGYVVDFIDLTFWPVFNVADSAICIGVAGLAYTRAVPAASASPGASCREPTERPMPERRTAAPQPRRPDRMAPSRSRCRRTPPSTRLDAFLAKYGEGRSRSDWQRLIQQGAVTLDGKLRAPERSRAERPAHPVSQTAAVAVQREFPPAAEIPVTIVYEDPSMIVVNKPAGLVVHPAPGPRGWHAGERAASRAFRIWPIRPVSSRPGIVHRLDKDTSGLIVDRAHDGGDGCAPDPVQGADGPEASTCCWSRATSPRKRLRSRCRSAATQRDRTADGRVARVGASRGPSSSVLERYGDFTLVEADLQSGRTHQLRVHFQFIGHPVAGDTTYGNVRGPTGLRRQFVHAAYDAHYVARTMAPSTSSTRRCRPTCARRWSGCARFGASRPRACRPGHGGTGGPSERRP